ncbi:MAG: hypothetical protein GY768_00980 [Planctomycetaceae bacterium]|nr:hypothetical protein [Planctomycetaceae bacterium]
MTRQTAVLAIFFALNLSVFATDASAGCRGRCRVSYRRPSRPVVIHRRQVIRPLVVESPTSISLPMQQLPTVPAGSTLTLPGNFLGTQPGSVLMVFNNVKLPVQILKWENHGVTMKLPPMAIRKPVAIRLDLMLPNGQLGLTQRVNVIPPATIQIHPTRPTSPLPTRPSGTMVAPAITQENANPNVPISLNRQPRSQDGRFSSPQQRLTNPSTAGTPAEPIVLPAQDPIAPLTTTLPAQNPSTQPILLPPITAEAEGQPTNKGTPPVNADPLENNPILNEHRSNQALDTEAANLGTSSSFFAFVSKFLND